MLQNDGSASEVRGTLSLPSSSSLRRRSGAAQGRLLKMSGSVGGWGSPKMPSRRKVIGGLAVVALVVGLSGPLLAGSPSGASTPPVKIGLVLSSAIGNNPFLANIKKGFLSAAKEFHYKASWVASKDTEAIQTNIETYASEGDKLVITNSFESVTGLEKVAKQFPKTKFGIIDTIAKGPNIRSIVFKEYQATFLAGYEMANMSKSHVIGFVGAYKDPLVSKWYGGISEGLAYAQRTEGIKTKMIDLFTNSFTDTATTKQLALQEIQQGADMIMPAAGAGEFGGYTACLKQHVWCEGIDTTFRHLNRYILDGERKRTDVGAFDLVDAFHAGTKPWNSVIHLGIAQSGVGLDSVINPEARTTKLLGKKLYSQLKKLSREVASGKVAVKDPCQPNNC